eukprot:4517183-Pleurochrysis_carterae.AAC.1
MLVHQYTIRAHPSMSKKRGHLRPLLLQVDQGRNLTFPRQKPSFCDPEIKLALVFPSAAIRQSLLFLRRLLTSCTTATKGLRSTGLAAVPSSRAVQPLISSCVKSSR